MNLCDDNRTATIEAAKMALIKGTNIEDSPEEMKVLDSFLLRCWQMGWLDKYDQIKTIELISDTSGLITKRMAIVALNAEIMTKRLNGEEGTLDEFDTEEIIRKLMPMQSYTSNALKALDDVNATQSNALDCISRKAAIELCDWYDNPSMREDLKKLPPARFSADTISRQRAINEVSRDITVNGWKDAERVVELMKIFADRIKQLPPAQPEHIIHCKDCENHLYRDWCRMVQHPTSDYSDCAKELYAKRKENDDE